MFCRTNLWPAARYVIPMPPRLTVSTNSLWETMRPTMRGILAFARRIRLLGAKSQRSDSGANWRPHATGCQVDEPQMATPIIMLFLDVETNAGQLRASASWLPFWPDTSRRGALPGSTP